MNITHYVIIGMLCLLLFVGFQWKLASDTVNEYELKIQSIEAQLSQERNNNQVLRDAIDKQNNMIANMSIETEKLQDRINILVNDIDNKSYSKEETIENDNANAEDAIEWLLKKSRQF